MKYLCLFTVPPTDAVVQAGPINVDSGRVVLNCTSCGLPAPQLVWQIGQQKVCFFRTAFVRRNSTRVQLVRQPISRVNMNTSA